MSMSPGQQGFEACPNREELAAFQVGQLPEPDLEAIGKHLEAPCARCEAALLQLQDQTDPLLADLRASQPLSPAEARSIGQVCQRIEQVCQRGVTTIDYAPSRGTRPVERDKIRIGRHLGEVTRRELEGLLRKRLCFAATFIACVYAVYLFKVAAFYADYQPSFIRYSLFLLVPVTFAGEVLAAWVLWTKKDLSLGQLRLLEWVTMGLPLLEQFCLECQRLFLDHQLALRSGVELDPVAAGRTHVLPWFVLIIAYGVLIPNTWRRCCAVVSAVAALGLALNVLAAVAERTTFHPAVLHHFVEVGLWLGFAVAFAIYNCYRIEQLMEDSVRRGQYRLLHWLGGGGMGEVYLAEHALLRLCCAVKLIRPEQAGDAATLDRFEREARKTAQLTHPNTVRIFDYGKHHDGTFYYAMEYLEGPDLGTLVGRHGPLPPGRAVYLLRQVCGALAEAHQHEEQLIHRDVKPGNLIVCVRGGLPDVCKLLDFGLVKKQPGLAPGGDQATARRTFMGSPPYTSPEQARGESENADPRTDLYSLGATAYFLLTGRPPFVRRTIEETLAAHVRDTPRALHELRADVPADLEAVVLRCLEKDPVRRFQSAEELEQALAGCACAAEWDRVKAAAWWRAYGARKK